MKNQGHTVYQALLHQGHTGMTRKMVPITGRASSFLEKDLYTLMLGFNNKIERRKWRRQNNNRRINLPQGNSTLHILHVQHLTLNFIIHNKFIISIVYVLASERQTLRSVQSRFAIYICAIVRMSFLHFDP